MGSTVIGLNVLGGWPPGRGELASLVEYSWEEAFPGREAVSGGRVRSPEVRAPSTSKTAFSGADGTKGQWLRSSCLPQLVRWPLPVYSGDGTGTTECLMRQMSLSAMEATGITS